MPSLFTGWPLNVILQCNVEAVASNTYFTVGKPIATCLVCFSSAVADFVIYNEVRSKACLEDIPSRDIREKLEMVS